MFIVLALYKINKTHVKRPLYYSANNVQEKITQF